MLKNTPPRHILLNRVDNLGDVILTLPIAAILKKQDPSCQVTFLGRSYTEAIIQRYPFIDHFLNWDALRQQPIPEQLSQLQKREIDTAIHFSPNKTLSKLMRKANIPLRIGTSHRWYHWLYCNKLVHYSRSQSNEHEAELNVKLLQPLNIEASYNKAALQDLLRFSQNEKPAILAKVKALLDPEKFNLIIHPMSNQSSRDWPLSHLRSLCQSLIQNDINVILTGSKKEAAVIRSEISAHCPGAKDCSGQLNLEELIALIQNADGLVANSTGPLHIAAACQIKVLGLFPPQKVIGPERWGPLSANAEVLTSKPFCDTRCDYQHCPCMQSITPSSVEDRILSWCQPTE